MYHVVWRDSVSQVHTESQSTHFFYLLPVSSEGAEHVSSSVEGSAEAGIPEME